MATTLFLSNKKYQCTASNGILGLPGAGLLCMGWATLASGGCQAAECYSV